ncbi:polysaccharide pyruvyl transferase family protein [Natronococcus roseus]|uniref:polysaccharide pyruvyl transferase family protein n=1 Tax=Natronococcus roseus TaxID=1052014 RepID=UPI00374DAA0D
MTRIFLDGYYGYSNVGDEAILQSLLDQLWKDDTITVATSDPVSTINTHPRIDKTIKRKSFHSINPYLLYSVVSATDYWKELKKADELWIGGGELIRDSSLYQHSILTIVARSLGTKVRFIGVGGAAVSQNWRNEFVLKPLLESTTSVTVRDDITKSNLQSLGVQAPITVKPDPVFSLSVSEPLSEDFKWIPHGNYCVIAVRSPSDREFDTRSFAKFIDELSNSTSLHPIFIPFHETQSPPDSQVAETIAKQMQTDATIIKRRVDYSDAYKIIEKADYVVGVRLHSLIYACNTETPFFGFAYAQKSKALLKELGQEVIWCDNIDVGKAMAIAPAEPASSHDKKNTKKIKESARDLVKHSRSKNNNSWKPLKLLSIIIFLPLIDLYYYIKNSRWQN